MIVNGFTRDFKLQRVEHQAKKETDGLKKYDSIKSL